MDIAEAPVPASSGFGPHAAAGMALLGAATIHAGAIGIHAEHRQAVLAFALLAVLQGAWGAIALVSRHRAVVGTGLVLCGAAVSGWIMAKTGGISFVGGLEQPEGPGWADTAAAGLSGGALMLLARAALAGTVGSPRPVLARSRPIMGAVVAGVCLLSLSTLDGRTPPPASAEAGSAGGHDHSRHGPSGGDGREVLAASVPPRPFHPDLPIDLSGVAGVTPQQQARAERLLAITLDRLPRYADVAVAEAAGYHSIGDGFTGHEHLINWSYIDDGHVLNPDRPESLVYEVDRETGERTLVSAMFMLPTGTSLRDVPDVGGALTQWHVHDDLCFEDDPVSPRVVGVTSVGGTCGGTTRKLDPVPMIHVWITPHPCGPFAALEGVAAGQVAEGETPRCNDLHGSHG